MTTLDTGQLSTQGLHHRRRPNKYNTDASSCAIQMRVNTQRIPSTHSSSLQTCSTHSDPTVITPYEVPTTGSYRGRALWRTGYGRAARGAFPLARVAITPTTKPSTAQTAVPATCCDVEQLSIRAFDTLSVTFLRQFKIRSLPSSTPSASGSPVTARRWTTTCTSCPQSVMPWTTKKGYQGSNRRRDH